MAHDVREHGAVWLEAWCAVVMCREAGREDVPVDPVVLGASAGPSDLVLPEGSCTELPRGYSLHPARGSSVQDASGRESAGSQEAPWPQRSTTPVVAI